MERVLYDIVKIVIDKTKHNTIFLKKNNLDRIHKIVKLPYTKVNVITGLTGAKGDTGAVFVPTIENGILSWEIQDNVSSIPPSTNIMANIDVITNFEIYTIVNS